MLHAVRMCTLIQESPQMQMVLGCGRGMSGMPKNHIKTNIIGWQCAVKCI